MLPLLDSDCMTGRSDALRGHGYITGCMPVIAASKPVPWVITTHGL